MYPENQENNMANQMKQNLIDSNTIKIKLIKSSLFTIDNIKKSLSKILSLELTQGMNVYNTSTGDIMLSLNLTTNDRILLHLYDYINEVFHAFFEYNMTIIREVLTIDEVNYLLDKSHTNLFYSLELYSKGNLTIRI